MTHSKISIAVLFMSVGVLFALYVTLTPKKEKFSETSTRGPLESTAPSCITLASGQQRPGCGSPPLCPGQITRNEFPLLLNAAGLVGEGVEVGVYRGEFSLKILKRWNGKRLHLVDLWSTIEDDGAGRKEYNYNRRSDYSWVLRRINRFPGSRTKIWPMESIAAPAHFRDGSLDFVYLDASHSALMVRKDLIAWYPKLKVGGLMSGHDWGMPEVQFAVNTSRQVVDKRVSQVHLTTEGYPSFYYFKCHPDRTDDRTSEGLSQIPQRYLKYKEKKQPKKRPLQ